MTTAHEAAARVAEYIRQRDNALSDRDAARANLETARAVALSNRRAHATAFAECERLTAELAEAKAAAVELEPLSARAEADKLRALIARMRPVLEYVSRGRSFVDVGPYPDATARFALGALDDAAAPQPDEDDDPVLPSQGRVVGHGVLRITREQAAGAGDGEQDTATTSPEAKFADLNVEDLRALLHARDTIRVLHRSADTDGRSSFCTHCTSLADCDVRWPCLTIRTLDGLE